MLLCLILAVLLWLSCAKERDNPFDPENPNTGGNPLNLTARLGQDGVELEWTSVEGFDFKRFKIFRDIAPLDSWTLLHSAMPNQRLYTDTQLTRDGEYHYCISAVGIDGQESEKSQSVRVSVDWSQKWSAIGSGINGPVFALAVYDGNLIAGGQFDQAGGVTVANIGAWDGSAWSPLESGMNGRVNCLAVYDGKLIAGGLFNEAGGVSVAYIASWNGSYWAAMGSAVFPSDYLDYPVRCLLPYVGRLYVGGSFSELAAFWNGSTFTSIGYDLGIGGDHMTSDFTIYRNNLVAGGYFFSSYCGLAEWYENDELWHPFIFNNLFSNVNALALYNDQLIAAGIKFVSPVEDSLKIISWNNFSVSYLAAQKVGRIDDLINYNGRLIAGGSFITLGNVAVNGIAAWDGDSWAPLGTSVDGQVLAFTIYDDRLIVGGQFTTAGGVSANNIASWFEWPSR